MKDFMEETYRILELPITVETTAVYLFEQKLAKVWKNDELIKNYTFPKEVFNALLKFKSIETCS